MYILFDIGGTNTRIATSDDLVTFENLTKFKTPLNYNDGLKKIEDTVRTLARDNKIEGLAGGIRGPLNQDKTGILSEVILTNWVGKNITGDLSNMFLAPAYLENDTAIVGLGEVHYGAAKDQQIVAYHTISTGVGGARFVGGQIDVASVGFEPGHQILDLGRTILGADVMPTLENLVSGAALERAFGVKPYEIDQSNVIWSSLAKNLAAGLRNTIVYWSPDIIVLGGSMMVGNPKIKVEEVRSYTEELMAGFMPCPKIVEAALGDDGGLYGAMALLKSGVK